MFLKHIILAMSLIKQQCAPDNDNWAILVKLLILYIHPYSFVIRQITNVYLHVFYSVYFTEFVNISSYVII